MRKILILAVCALAPCFLYAKSQISITARTYLNPKAVFDEETLKETVGLDVGMTMLNSLGSILFGIPNNTQSITAASMTMVQKGGGTISVNGIKKASTPSAGNVNVIVSPGNHTISVCYPYDDNGYYIVCGEENVYVGSNAHIGVVVNADKLYMTDKGKIAKERAEARQAEERRQRAIREAEEQRQRELKEAEERRLEEIRKAEEKRLEELRIAEEKRQREIWEAKTKREGVNQNFKAYQNKFTRDDGLGVVVDPVAGLMWQDGQTASAPVSWKNAKKYCDDLKYGEYSDWRLPNINELSSITDDDKFNPSLNGAFRYYSKSDIWYWTSTPNSKNSLSAWYVNFRDGGTYWSDVSAENSVRCVRNIKQ